MKTPLRNTDLSLHSTYFFLIVPFIDSRNNFKIFAFLSPLRFFKCRFHSYWLQRHYFNDIYIFVTLGLFQMFYREFYMQDSGCSRILLVILRNAWLSVSYNRYWCFIRRIILSNNITLFATISTSDSKWKVSLANKSSKMTCFSMVANKLVR